MEWDRDFTRISIVINQRVSITESFYPSLSFTELFTSLGGSLGLWLGVGAVQLCLHAFNFVAHCKNLILRICS